MNKSNNPVFDMLGKKAQTLEKQPKKEDVTRVLHLDVEEDFNMTEDQETNKFLKDKALEVLGTFGRTSVELGRIFGEVNARLANYHNGVYIAWLEKNGFNRMTAFRHIRRYELYSLVNSENGKNFVMALPFKLVDSIFRYGDIEGVAAVISEGTTRKEVEAILETEDTNKDKAILSYNPKETEKTYRSIGQIYKKVSFDKIEKDKIEAFEKDLKRVEKILSKWAIETK